MWRTTRTPEGPVTFRAEVVERAVVQAWGPGAEYALEHIGTWLGFDDDPDALEPKDDVVARAKRRHPGLRLGRGRPIFEVLVPIIIGQRVTTAEASDSWRHLVFSHGEQAPGPCRLFVPPPVEAFKRISLPGYHRFGIEGSRAKVILEACHHARFVEAVTTLPPNEAVRQLRKLPGIGPWTADCYLLFALRRCDRFPAGDLALQEGYRILYQLNSRPDAAQLAQWASRWQPHRAAAARLLWRYYNGERKNLAS